MKKAHLNPKPSKRPTPKRAPDDSHALVIVDVQDAFPVPPALVERIRAYSRRFDCRIFTRFVNVPGSLFRRSLKQHSCAPGSDDLRLLIEPTPHDLVFDKRGYGLAHAQIRRLKARGIKRVTVCGVDTDACVMGVMFSLFDAGIEPRLRTDLCWSSTGLHGPAMKILKEQFPAPKRGASVRR